MENISSKTIKAFVLSRVGIGDEDRDFKFE